MNNCKICGKQPKIKFKYGSCVIVCKPMFKRTHWVVEAPTKEMAVTYWNERNQ